ncbi:MAG: hypothetical protein EBS19_08110, partial [Spirochaetia bacterium]|nr:hypothetical protein [Spirochaetia bacterium]
MALVDLKSDLSWYGKPPAVNYFPDSISGEKGFTDKMTSTQYIGVENNSYTYPTTVRGGRLMQPKASVKFPGPQNFFDDKKSGATGFTLYMEPKNGSKLPSQFTVDADVLIVPRKNSKYPEFTGDGTLKNQLGLGSPFRYLKNGSFSTKAFSNAGTNSKNTYESTIVNGQSHLLVKATEQNSPSAIDEEYKKHNLRDESYNPTYMAQPFILRGIQRKGEEKPQYWGFGSKSGFDDGLIRGGAVTVADRIVADTDRIAKFMASPKGLLWVVKQIGLGLTNPKVEVNPNAPLRQTRIHTGITSMLSVPGTPLGLHVPAHGNPFTYEVANYENVQREKINLWGNSKNPLAENRLVDLKNKFFNYKTLTLPIIGLPKIVKIIINDTLLQKGQSILPLSGLGGPGSVYGIGSTTIKRVVDTGLESLQRAAYPVDRPNAGFKVKYQYSEPYINK